MPWVASERQERRRGGPARAGITALALLAAGLGTAAIAAAPAAADPAWDFEQVTPVVKGGGTVSGVDTFRVSPDGNRFLLTANSSFAGVPSETSPQYVRYLSTRGADGWSNRPLDPPGSMPFPQTIYIMALGGSSANLKHVIVGSTRALTPGATEGGSNLYMRDTRTGAYTLIATTPDTRFASDFFNNGGANLMVKFIADDGRSALILGSNTSSLTPGAPGGALYSWTADRGLRVESVLPASEGGEQVATNSVGADREAGTRDALPHAGALDHIYFAARTADTGGTGPVYVRTAGVTRPVSVSHIEGASPDPVAATVEAVSEGGRYALIKTVGVSRLTAEAPEDLNSSALYRYDVDHDVLTYVGATAGNGAAAMQMTRDGETVAFSSHAALAPGATDGDALNFYVWRKGTLRYVSTTDPGGSGSGGTDDWPTSGESDVGYLHLLSPDGRYLAFTDESLGLGLRFGQNTMSTACTEFNGLIYRNPGRCSEVYLFDADEGKLACVSCRADGSPAKGHFGDVIATRGRNVMNSQQARTVTDDGTVFFTSPNDLLPADRNGKADVYSYRDGQLQLLSRGTVGTKARFLDATADGRHVFFATDDAIAPTDDDRAVDVYATGPDAGFPYTPPDVVAPCSGSDCRGASTPGAPLDPPASLRGELGGANPKAPATRKATVRVTGASLRGTRLQLTVRTSQAGGLRVSGSALRTSARTVKRAGTSHITLRLTPRAQKTLKQRGRLAVRTRVSLTPPFGRAAVTTSRRTLRK